MSKYADTSSGMTQAAVAQSLGISIARVGQLENAALRKLRQRPDLLAALAELAKELQKNRRNSNSLMEVR